MGTQGQLATLSDSTVEGGPGLEDVLSNNDKLGNDSRLGLCYYKLWYVSCASM